MQYILVVRDSSDVRPSETCRWCFTDPGIIGQLRILPVEQMLIQQ